MIYLIVGLLGAISWLLILQRWRYGLFLLIGYLPFGGVIVLLSNDNPVMTLAKTCSLSSRFISLFSCEEYRCRKRACPRR
jgi:hypothetical protein